MTAKRTVIVVDDDEAMRLAMSRVLERAGFGVEAVAGGRAALARMEQQEFSALVSDVRMPELDGRELLTKALSLQPGLKAILVTAFGTVQDAVDAVRLGASDYLLKPFAPEALVAALVRALETTLPLPGDRSERPLIGQEPVFVELIEQASRAAKSDATVMLCGESGTGKELLARLIHARSRRAKGPFVAINCAALPADLLEAELFGVRRGAFTGADRDRLGLFERAHGGTLLLDEVGDLPLALQAKLLRALEERAIAALGSGESKKIDIRVLAATHQDLSEAVARGSFRQDLYFRLCVIPLRVPALRERRGDIPLLVEQLALEACRRLDRPAVDFSRRAMERLQLAAWPGNVRQLRNVVERAVVLHRGSEISADDLFLDETTLDSGDTLAPGMTIAEAERRLIRCTLEAAGGNRTRASAMLGISVRTLRNKLREARQEEGAEFASASTP